ncbi:MAG: MotA/TolQ/ExbB proton channel family protein [Sumerlaeia bacterium]
MPFSLSLPALQAVVDAPLSPISLGAFGLGVNIVEAITQSDNMGRICLLTLLVMSVWSSAIIVAKFREIRLAVNQTENFMHQCFEGQKSLSEIYQIAENFPNSPLANLLSEAYIQYEIEAEQESAEVLSFEQRLHLSRTCVESVLERTISSEMRRLDNRLIGLATTSTLAPFIGLFGTVWGVLGSFQSMGHSGAGDLTTLAPGLSTALVTTIAGLVVAIPAVAFYNYLSANVSRLNSQMESFAYELSTIFQKHLLRRG